MTEKDLSRAEQVQKYKKIVDGALARFLVDKANETDIQSDLLREAAERLERIDRFTRLLALVAPVGTAPRTALEQLWKQSKVSDEETQVVVDFREMLQQHNDEWTPALREAEGLPSVEE